MNRLIYILLFLPLGVCSQSQLGWLNSDPIKEFDVPNSIDFHSALRPWVGKTNSFVPKDSSILVEHKPFVLFPLADMGAFGPNRPQLRAMAGAGGEFHPNDKFYARVAYLQGAENINAFHASKSAYLETQGELKSAIDLRARLSYSPNKIVNLQAGFDEIFIGEGSRSLFLGDYGLPYGYASGTLNFWRIQYTTIYQFFKEPYYDGSGNFDKFGATHYLSTNITKWLHLGIFETVIFNPDQAGLNRGFEPEFLNPMIFYRPQEYALGSSDNVLLGVDGTIKIKDKVSLYGQLLLDEFSLAEIRAKSQWWANKFGIQAGIKGKVKMKNGQELFLRGEINTVKPFTYSHLSNAQSYSNRNNVLAHPYGANFAEILAQASIVNDRWSADMFLNFTLRGNSLDSINYGENIYIPYLNRTGDFGHVIGQGAQNRALRHMFRVGYMIVPKGRLEVFSEIQTRYNSLVDEPNVQVIVGLRSKLWNDYRNF